MKPLALLFLRLTQCTGLRFNPRVADEMLRNADHAFDTAAPVRAGVLSCQRVIVVAR